MKNQISSKSISERNINGNKNNICFLFSMKFNGFSQYVKIKVMHRKIVNETYMRDVTMFVVKRNFLF